MLNYFFSQIVRTFGVFFRTIRAFVIRRCAGLVAAIRRMTNFSRGAAKTANSAMQSAVAASQKPSKREDYVEMGRLLVSKALILKIIVLLAAAILLIYFVLWPLILSHFLTARFYIEDKRLDDWTGRVIVYSDKEKTIPAYAGRLEEGVLQGQGKLYDQDGVLSYEGGFLDGLRSGVGNAYEDGLLIYEGQYENDVYEGTGTQYEEESLVYVGEFSNGHREGQGKFYSNGELRYEGGFQADLFSGDGIAYENDRVIYRGQFENGVYSGAGTLYPVEGQEVAGTFENGVPVGVVKWSKDGRLYYEGEWSDGGPHEYGVLYNKDGKAIYQGQWKNGTLDGAWLLNLPLDELRAALGEDNAKTEARAAGGFRLTSAPLGLTVLCSYQTEEADTMAYGLYLYRPETGGGWVQLMPEVEKMLLAAGAEDGDVWNGRQRYAAVEGVPLTSGSYLCQSVTTDMIRRSMLYEEGDSQASLMVWSLLRTPTAGLELPGEEQGGDVGSSELDEFLTSLDSMEGTGVVQSGDNPYYGSKDPNGALSASGNAEQATKLMDAMLTYWVQAEGQAAQEENLARVNALLESARQDLAMGQGSKDAVSDLNKQKQKIEQSFEEYTAQRKKAQIQGQSAGCQDLSAYALDNVTVFFDPTKQNVKNLALVAAAYQQSIGKEVDSETLETQMKTLLVDLADLYQKGEAALEAFQDAAEDSRKAAGDYAMGKGTRQQWYDALSAQADARVRLFASLGEFSKTANELNLLTGGWVSRTFQWFNDSLGAKFYTNS